MISTAVEVSFLSRSFRSLNNFPKWAPSIIGTTLDPAPKAQKVKNTCSTSMAVSTLGSLLTRCYNGGVILVSCLVAEYWRAVIAVAFWAWSLCVLRALGLSIKLWSYNTKLILIKLCLVCLCLSFNAIIWKETPTPPPPPPPK